MSTVVLNGPMSRYGLKGKVFTKFVPKSVNSETRDLCIGTGFFSDYERRGIKKATAVPKEPGKPKFANEEPPFGGRGGKAAAIYYGEQEHNVTLSADLSVRVLNDQLSHLADGGSCDELEGAVPYEEEIEDDQDADESESGKEEDGDGGGEVDM